MAPDAGPGAAAPGPVVRAWRVLAPVALYLAVTAALQWSVVRFRVPIVLVLTVFAVALAGWLAGRVRPAPDRPGAALALAGSALTAWLVPLFSHLSRTDLTDVRVVLTTAAGLLAVLLITRRDLAALIGSAVALVVLTVRTIEGAPAPTIDVWVTLQRAADVLGEGGNIYATVITGTHGVQDFTYLPWTSVLLAPGRWLAGDVRWALLGWSLVLLAAVAVLAGREHRGRAAAVAALLVTMPGTITQVDQAWTEPLLAALLAVTVALTVRDRPGWAILPLALALASKQHIVLLLPLFAAWRAFGWRRTLAAGAGAGLLVLPWVVAGPRDFLHDTVTLLVGFPPLRFANTWYLLLRHEFGLTPPFWLTGVVVLAAVAVLARWVHRSATGAAGFLGSAALLLLVANLVNKQAFYNQYWLSVVLLLLALLAATAGRDRVLAPRRPLSRRSGASPGAPAPPEPLPR